MNKDDVKIGSIVYTDGVMLLPSFRNLFAIVKQISRFDTCVAVGVSVRQYPLVWFHLDDVKVICF